MSETIYVSLPLEAAREIRKTLLNKAAALASQAAQDPSDSELREQVTKIYYTVSDLDEKLTKKEEEK